MISGKQNERHLFQPTLPVWGETSYIRQYIFPVAISTHSPRVGRDMVEKTHLTTITDFNPLSPCGERPPELKNPKGIPKFQPTLPVWGETRHTQRISQCHFISTHSPRVGRDQFLPFSRPPLYNFNPLSPCGERPL